MNQVPKFLGGTVFDCAYPISLYLLGRRFCYIYIFICMNIKKSYTPMKPFTFCKACNYSVWIVSLYELHRFIIDSFSILSKQ